MYVRSIYNNACNIAASYYNKLFVLALIEGYLLLLMAVLCDSCDIHISDIHKYCRYMIHMYMGWSAGFWELPRKK